MKKINKTLVFSAIILSSSFLQQNLYAGFFDQISSGISSGIKSTITGDSSTHQKSAKTEPVQAKKEVVATGSVSKTVNVRSGPGSKNAKVGKLTPESKITILDTQGNWLKIEAETSAGFVAGWVYKPLVNIGVSTVSSNGVTIVGKTETRQNVYYAGYSKDFQKVKQMMASGNLKGVEKFYTDREAEVLKKNQTKWQAMEEIGLLRWMERGTLYLDKANVEKSIKSFGNAEDILIVRQKNSKTSDFISSIASFTAETVTGNEEFQEYPGEGYEKVLMLNYKSIAFLLDGERQAYNVARRAIDWQNMEKARFREEIEEAKKETKKAEKDIKDKDASNTEWKASYKKLDKIATRVPSAFVNPFGYYVTGMIQEYEAKKDASLRDNARIAYEKALKLNPKSKVLKQAVKDMKRNKSSGNKRLLHVVVADGFAPEKKMLIYNFPSGNGVVPIKLPIYEPVASKVARVEVQTTGGKRLATLSSVADVEAICLRNQKDSEAFRSLRMTIAIARAVGVNQAASNLGLFGSLLSSAVNDMAAPDMRSWMSLPAKLQAARLYISKNTKKLKIVSFDARGRRLASKTVDISNKSDAFIYARSIDKQLYVNASNTLWTAQ
ncbi:MAG: SH3 domain-containing protein [gamma proteobacterium symbiont of Taylorina sp.]|nr:SH3 domain-containing protein [gamma proteobacterium symbiont of Taylorina sp.]